MENHFRVLMATDYSESAQNAAYYAIQLAKNINATLTLLHVYQIPFNSPPDPEEFAVSAEKLRNAELKYLEQHCDELCSIFRISRENLLWGYVVREGGNIAKQIIREAEESNTDFIVVGTHGVTGFRKLFLGSRAWDIIRKSRKPVFAIPLEACFVGIKTIVFGIEYREGEIPGLNYVVHFARMFNAEVIALHITNYVLSKKFEAEMFGVFKNEVLNKINYPKLKMHLLVSENISEGVHEFCADNEIDLLVMSPGKPALFEKYFSFNMMSMTRKTILHTRVPLLAIPDFYGPEHSESPQSVDTGGFANAKA